MEKQIIGIVMAAGKGTRMKSELPKVLHRVGGIPMVEHVARAMADAGSTETILVVGHGADLVRAQMGDGYFYGLQDPPQGTGDAARVGVEAAGVADPDAIVLISSGDTPLITAEALAALRDKLEEGPFDAVIATVVKDNPTGYGRVLWSEDGLYRGIVEEKDATPEQRAIIEVCVSVYAFRHGPLIEALARLDNKNAQGEFYLTDVPLLIQQAGGRVTTLPYAVEEVFNGVNDRIQLADAEVRLRRRINEGHMARGVTMIDPSSTYIELDVEIGADTVLLPGVVLEGHTRIGARCEIGPYVRLENAQIADGVTVRFASIKGSTVGSESRVGPFATLRDGADIGHKVKIGNFVEVKNSRLHERVSASHLTYLGDSEIGERTNIGAGTITCNYDGFAKNRTKIGANAFIGSNSTLVAPLEIGDDAMVAAGSVVTNDVPPGAAAFGRARQETKEQWVARWREKRLQRKS